MDGEGRGADSVADELPEYKRAIEAHQEHPVVKRWFHQITPCQVAAPGGGAASFLMIEFRDGGLGAMVWSDGNGNRGMGGWRPVRHAGACWPSTSRTCRRGRRPHLRRGAGYGRGPTGGGRGAAAEAVVAVLGVS